MATVLEKYTAEEQRSVVCFCGQKVSVQRIFIKKCFLFVVGNVCCIKKFHLGEKRSADDEEVQTEVQKWLRQQSKYFCGVGFDTLVEQWDKCINFAGRCVKK
jgi:hypothetical protein